jgi:hypothetical protein
MKLLRLVLSVVSALILGGGFLLSLSFALDGRASEYAARVDQPAIVQLSLLILVAAIVLAFIPDRDDPGESSE